MKEILVIGLIIIMCIGIVGFALIGTNIDNINDKIHNISVDIKKIKKLLNNKRGDK